MNLGSPLRRSLRAAGAALSPISPSGATDWRGVIVQSMALLCLTALTFKFGAAMIPITTGILGTVLGAASIRGRMLPPGYSVFPPGIARGEPPAFRLPSPSHTGFSDAPTEAASLAPPPPTKKEDPQ